MKIINIFALKEEAEMEAYRYFDANVRKLPKKDNGEIDVFAPGLVDNDVDAFRHSYTSGVFTQVLNEKSADVLGQLQEANGNGYGSTNNGDLSKNMDLWNNAVGRKYGKKSQSRNELAKCLQQALKDGQLIIDLSDKRQYTGQTSYIIDPDKPVIVVSESDTGRNEIFVDLIKWQGFDRESFVSMVEAGEYSGYRISSIGDIATPVSRADGDTVNNLG